MIFAGKTSLFVLRHHLKLNKLCRELLFLLCQVVSHDDLQYIIPRRHLFAEAYCSAKTDMGQIVLAVRVYQ